MIYLRTSKEYLSYNGTVVIPWLIQARSNVTHSARDLEKIPNSDRPSASFCRSPIEDKPEPISTENSKTSEYVFHLYSPKLPSLL
ncbi:unnamed protein product [Blepharisma stoltei]|uniref:Uncharacterized protein n=1 Tax=Blepharisma stoltei TaxID=1481888 RepID=A0AAU9JGN4_9CILI|nr:unnamed protein product [Blepharisma stoltei]